MADEFISRSPSHLDTCLDRILVHFNNLLQQSIVDNPYYYYLVLAGLSVKPDHCTQPRARTGFPMR